MVMTEIRVVETEISSEPERDVLAALRAGLRTEIEHADRYAELRRLALEAGLLAEAEAMEAASDEEWLHVARLVERIVELGGSPFPPSEGEEPAEAEPGPPEDPQDKLRMGLEAERLFDRLAVQFYGDLCDRTWDSDPNTADLALQALIEDSDRDSKIDLILARWPY